MKIAIFDEINKELDKQKRKSPWLAEEVGTSSRNMYDILKKRKDIYVSDLAEISIALKRNFFKLYIPFVDAGISAALTKDNLPLEKVIEETSSVNIKIKYPESQTSEVGIFLKQLKLLAKEYDFEIE